ncbi:MAG: VWA domain-containing protein [Brooklawnia sp.]|jgi:Ca-activated chloride channel family protein
MVPMIDFMHPGRLWLMLLVAGVAVLYLVLSSRLRTGTRRQRTRLDLVIPRDSPIKRHLSVLAALLAMAALILAYAKPIGYMQVPRERATVVITIDISKSMRAQDVAPSRIEAAQTAAKEFVDMLPTTFNIAVVAFGGTTTMVSPPTLDRGAVKRAIDSLELIPATAVGEGVFTSLDALMLAPPDPDNPDEPAPGAVILLSDGYTNSGREPSVAAQAAADQDVPVYTIAYGTPGGYVYEEGVRVPVPVNHRELLELAQISGGKKYTAESLGDLRDVYETLASSIGYEDVEVEVTERYALYALVCSVLAGLGVISLAARWP